MIQHQQQGTVLQCEVLTTSFSHTSSQHLHQHNYKCKYSNEQMKHQTTQGTFSIRSPLFMSTYPSVGTNNTLPSGHVASIKALTDSRYESHGLQLKNMADVWQCKKS